MALTTRMQLALDASLTGAAGLATPVVPLSVSALLQLTSGTGAGQADKMYAATRTLTASSTEDLDLAGVLTDGFGAAITFVKVKALYIKAAAANANNVVVGAASSNAWAALLNAAGTVTLRPGAVLLAAAGPADATGYAVTAGTGDLVKVANSAGGASVSYDIAVIGTSA